jgi:undecaprenyl-diphosphatase
MPLEQAVILAVIQGLTEFLPVSSSAHLALAPWLLGWPDQGLTFDIALHAGTLLAVLVYFFRDWLRISKENPKLFVWIGLATIPVGVAGLLIHDYAEKNLRTPFVMGPALIVVAGLMALAEKVGRRDKAEAGFLDAMLIGLAQALALIPGTSRSGITISAGLFRNLDRAAAARFSFLLSTPAVAAACAKGGYELYKTGIPPDMHAPFAVGVAVSAAVGCLAIGVLMRFVKRFSLYTFVIYRILFGLLVLGLAFKEKFFS